MKFSQIIPGIMKNGARPGVGEFIFDGEIGYFSWLSIIVSDQWRFDGIGLNIILAGGNQPGLTS